jgi:DNA-binding CsgD family transcriptional regulator
MQPQGWRHSVALCFWGNPLANAPVFVASANRAQGQCDFSAHDLTSLENTHPFLDCAVNRLHEREAATTVRDAMAMTVRNGKRGFAILDRRLALVHANPVARRLCGACLDERDVTARDGTSRAWRLPSVLETACHELNQEWQSVLRADPDATACHHNTRVLHSPVPGLTASITMVCPDVAGFSEPTFVVEFDRSVHGVALEGLDDALPVLAKMSPAERAVAMVLADGRSNQEIADQLGKSVPAVKFLLHRIYQKSGFPNRATLVAFLRSRPTEST